MATIFGYGIVVEKDEKYGWMVVDNTSGVVEHCGSEEESMAMARRWVEMYREGM